MESICQELANGDDSNLLHLLDLWNERYKSQYTSLRQRFSTLLSDNDIYSSNRPKSASTVRLSYADLHSQFDQALQLQASLVVELEALQEIRNELEDSYSFSEVHIRLERVTAENRKLQSAVKSAHEQIADLYFNTRLLEAELVVLRSDRDRQLAEANERIRVTEKAVIAATTRLKPTTKTSPSSETPDNTSNPTAVSTVAKPTPNPTSQPAEPQSLLNRYLKKQQMKDPNHFKQYATLTAMDFDEFDSLDEDEEEPIVINDTPVSSDHSAPTKIPHDVVSDHALVLPRASQFFTPVPPLPLDPELDEQSTRPSLFNGYGGEYPSPASSSTPVKTARRDELDSFISSDAQSSKDMSVKTTELEKVPKADYLKLLDEVEELRQELDELKRNESAGSSNRIPVGLVHPVSKPITAGLTTQLHELADEVQKSSDQPKQSHHSHNTEMLPTNAPGATRIFDWSLNQSALSGVDEKADLVEDLEMQAPQIQVSVLEDQIESLKHELEESRARLASYDLDNRATSLPLSEELRSAMKEEHGLCSVDLSIGDTKLIELDVPLKGLNPDAAEFMEPSPYHVTDYAKLSADAACICLTLAERVASLNRYHHDEKEAFGIDNHAEYNSLLTKLTDDHVYEASENPLENGYKLLAPALAKLNHEVECLAASLESDLYLQCDTKSSYKNGVVDGGRDQEVLDLRTRLNAALRLLAERLPEDTQKVLTDASQIIESERIQLQSEFERRIIQFEHDHTSSLTELESNRRDLMEQITKLEKSNSQLHDQLSVAHQKLLANERFLRDQTEERELEREEFRTELARVEKQLKSTKGELLASKLVNDSSTASTHLTWNNRHQSDDSSCRTPTDCLPSTEFNTFVVFESQPSMLAQAGYEDADEDTVLLDSSSLTERSSPSEIDRDWSCRQSVNLMANNNHMSFVDYSSSVKPDADQSPSWTDRSVDATYRRSSPGKKWEDACVGPDSVELKREGKLVDSETSPDTYFLTASNQTEFELGVNRIGQIAIKENGIQTEPTEERKSSVRSSKVIRKVNITSASALLNQLTLTEEEEEMVVSHCDDPPDNDFSRHGSYTLQSQSEKGSDPNQIAIELKDISTSTDHAQVLSSDLISKAMPSDHVHQDLTMEDKGTSADFGPPVTSSDSLSCSYVLRRAFSLPLLTGHSIAEDTGINLSHGIDKNDLSNNTFVYSPAAATTARSSLQTATAECESEPVPADADVSPPHRSNVEVLVDIASPPAYMRCTESALADLVDVGCATDDSDLEWISKQDLILLLDEKIRTDAAIATLQNEIESLQKHQEELQSDYGLVQEMLVDREAELERYTEDLLTLQDRCSTLEKQANGNTNVLLERDEDLFLMAQENESLQGKIKDLEIRLSNATNKDQTNVLVQTDFTPEADLSAAQNIDEVDGSGDETRVSDQCLTNSDDKTATDVVCAAQPSAVLRIQEEEGNFYTSTPNDISIENCSTSSCPVLVQLKVLSKQLHEESSRLYSISHHPRLTCEHMENATNNADSDTTLPVIENLIHANASLKDAHTELVQLIDEGSALKHPNSEPRVLSEKFRSFVCSAGKALMADERVWLDVLCLTVTQSMKSPVCKEDWHSTSDDMHQCTWVTISRLVERITGFIQQEKQYRECLTRAHNVELDCEKVALQTAVDRSNKLLTDVDRLSDSLSSHKQALVQSDTLNLRLTNEVSTLNGELCELQSKLDKQDVELERLKTTSDHFDLHLKTEQQKVTSLIEQVDATEAENTHLRNDLHNVTAAMKELQVSLDSTVKRAEIAENSLSELKGQWINYKQSRESIENSPPEHSSATSPGTREGKPYELFNVIKNTTSNLALARRAAIEAERRSRELQESNRTLRLNIAETELQLMPFLVSNSLYPTQTHLRSITNTRSLQRSASNFDQLKGDCARVLDMTASSGNEGLDDTLSSSDEDDDQHVSCLPKSDGPSPRIVSFDPYVSVHDDTSINKAPTSIEVIPLTDRPDVHGQTPPDLSSTVNQLSRSASPNTFPPTISLDRFRILNARYLRSESYRRALTFQKRYLLLLLGGFQHPEEVVTASLGRTSVHSDNSISTTADSIDGLRTNAFTTSRPLRRFRAAARTVVVIYRMRYMVERWRRSGLQIPAHEAVRSSALSLTSPPVGPVYSPSQIAPTRIPLKELTSDYPLQTTPLTNRLDPEARNSHIHNGGRSTLSRSTEERRFNAVATAVGPTTENSHSLRRSGGTSNNSLQRHSATSKASYPIHKQMSPVKAHIPHVDSARIARRSIPTNSIVTPDRRSSMHQRQTSQNKEVVIPTNSATRYRTLFK